MLKPFPVNRLTASRRRRCFDTLRRLRLAVKRFAHFNLRVLPALQSGAVQLGKNLLHDVRWFYTGEPMIETLVFERQLLVVDAQTV